MIKVDAPKKKVKKSEMKNIYNICYSISGSNSKTKGGKLRRQKKSSNEGRRRLMGFALRGWYTTHSIRMKWIKTLSEIHLQLKPSHSDFSFFSFLKGIQKKRKGKWKKHEQEDWIHQWKQLPFLPQQKPFYLLPWPDSKKHELNVIQNNNRILVAPEIMEKCSWE